MRSRPISLTILSLIYFGIAISMPVQIMSLYDYGFGEIDGVLSKLTFLNWAIMFASTICGLWIAQASRYALLGAPLVIGLVAFNNYVVGSYAIDYSFEITCLATGAFAFVNLPLFMPRLRLVLSYPHLQWWRTSPRQKIRLPILVGSKEHPQLLTETYDLSESGVFIPLTEKVKTRGQRFDPSERLRLNFNLGALSQIHCEGVVVRRQSARGQYPAGFGIQFAKMPTHQRKALRRYLELYAQL